METTLAGLIVHPLLDEFSPFTSHFSASIIYTPQINSFNPNPCFNVCFWGSQNLSSHTYRCRLREICPELEFHQVSTTERGRGEGSIIINLTETWGKEEKRLGCYISVCPLLLRKMSRLPKALLLVPLTGPPTSHRGSSSLHWTPGLGYPGCGLNPSLPRQDLCPDSLHFLLSPLPGAQVLTWSLHIH